MKRVKLLKKVLLTVAIMGGCLCAGMGAREVKATETTGTARLIGTVDLGVEVFDSETNNLITPADVKFGLYTSEGDFMGKYITDQYGRINLELEPGTYYFKEIKRPEKYYFYSCRYFSFNSGLELYNAEKFDFTITYGEEESLVVCYDPAPIDCSDFIAGIFTGVNAEVYWQDEITLEAPATNTFTAELYRDEQLLETVQNNACFFTFGKNEYNSQLFETLEEKFMAWANGETVEPYSIIFTVKQAIPADVKNIAYDTTIYTVTRDIYFGNDGNIMYGGKIEADGAETELEQITFINTKTGVDAEPETPETPEAEEPEKTEPIVTPGDLTNVYISKLRIRRIIIFDKDGNIGVYPKY